VNMSSVSTLFRFFSNCGRSAPIARARLSCQATTERCEKDPHDASSKVLGAHTVLCEHQQLHWRPRPEHRLAESDYAAPSAAQKTASVLHDMIAIASHRWHQITAPMSATELIGYKLKDDCTLDRLGGCGSGGSNTGLLILDLFKRVQSTQGQLSQTHSSGRGRGTGDWRCIIGILQEVVNVHFAFACDRRRNEATQSTPSAKHSQKYPSDSNRNILYP
jgi:hypothetical protein